MIKQYVTLLAYLHLAAEQNQLHMRRFNLRGE